MQNATFPAIVGGRVGVLWGNVRRRLPFAAIACLFFLNPVLTVTHAQQILPPRDISGSDPIPLGQEGLIVGLDPTSMLHGDYQSAAFGSGDAEALDRLRRTLAELARAPLSSVTLSSGGEVIVSVDLGAMVDLLIEDLNNVTAVLSMARIVPVKGQAAPYGILVRTAPDAPPIVEFLTVAAPMSITEVGEHRYLIALDIVELNQTIAARLDQDPAVLYVQPNFVLPGQ